MRMAVKVSPGFPLPLFLAWASVLLGGTRSESIEQPGPILGRWEYRQAALPGEFDPEGEILEFAIVNGKVTGTYHGLQREGEHGLFYTLVDVDSLALGDNRKISFIVPPRAFYSKRISSKTDLETEEPRSAGFSKGILKFNGEIVGDKLVLKCASDMNECPDDKMVFRKGKW